MRIRNTAIAIATVLALWGVTAQAAEARTDNRNKPVYFVHGYENGSDANCNQWDAMVGKFRDWGHDGPFERIGYYHNDVNCTDFVSHHGNHSTHHASGHHDGAHTEDTNIRHLAYHLAWHIYDHHTVHGRYVDVVGHSMGGLIIRYALGQVDLDHPSFPPNLRVEDAVTMGSPHGGARFAAWCIGCNTQVQQMEMGSDFLVWMQENAWSPDGYGGTQWTAMGSDDDNQVAADRAAATDSDRDPVNKYMGTCHKAWYEEDSNIEHGDFRNTTSAATTADVRVYECGEGWTYYNGGGIWPVRRADLAVTYGSH
jgi:triacylglycerol esterase/lipase EstA (alpha/beta hydrolase family)